jgi:hypothetical protein
MAMTAAARPLFILFYLFSYVRALAGHWRMGGGKSNKNIWGFFPMLVLL